MDRRPLLGEPAWAFSLLTAASVFTEGFDAHSVTEVVCVCVCGVGLRQLVLLKNTRTSSDSQAEADKRHPDPGVKPGVAVRERYL